MQNNAGQQPPPVVGMQSDWRGVGGGGGGRAGFRLQGVACFVVCPATSLPALPPSLR